MDSTQLTSHPPCVRISYRHYWLIFTSTIALSVAIYSCTTRVSPWGILPLQEGDSAGYLGNSASRDIRTPGYPLFLELVRLFSKDLLWLPTAQYGVFTLAVAFLATSLYRFGVSIPASILAGGTLAAAPVLANYGHYVFSEVLAVSFFLLSFASILYHITEPRRWRWMLLLALVVPAAYLTRPSFLFLIATLPIATLMLAPASVFLEIPKWRFVSRLFLLLFLPFVLYCVIHGARTGVFGLTPFGGINLIGIAGQFIDDRTLSRLDGENRRLAERIIVMREERFPGSRSKYDNRIYRHIASRYNDMCWHIAIPAAWQLYGECNWIEANRRFLGLSRALLISAPKSYASWLFHAGQAALLNWRKYDNTSAWLALYCCLLFIFSTTFPTIKDFPSLRILRASLFMFFAGSILVILVEPPIPRYLEPISLLIPAALAILAWEWSSKIITIYDQKNGRPFKQDR